MHNRTNDEKQKEAFLAKCKHLASKMDQADLKYAHDQNYFKTIRLEYFADSKFDSDCKQFGLRLDEKKTPTGRLIYQLIEEKSVRILVYFGVKLSQSTALAITSKPAALPIAKKAKIDIDKDPAKKRKTSAKSDQTSRKPEIEKASVANKPTHQSKKRDDQSKIKKTEKKSVNLTEPSKNSKKRKTQDNHTKSDEPPTKKRKLSSEKETTSTVDAPTKPIKQSKKSSASDKPSEISKLTPAKIEAIFSQVLTYSKKKQRQKKHKDDRDDFKEAFPIITKQEIGEALKLEQFQIECEKHHYKIVIFNVLDLQQHKNRYELFNNKGVQKGITRHPYLEILREKNKNTKLSNLRINGRKITDKDIKEIFTEISDRAYSVQESVRHQKKWAGFAFIQSIYYWTKVKFDCQLTYLEFKKLCDTHGFELCPSRYNSKGIKYKFYLLLKNPELDFKNRVIDSYGPETVIGELLPKFTGIAEEETTLNENNNNPKTPINIDEIFKKIKKYQPYAQGRNNFEEVLPIFTEKLYGKKLDLKALKKECSEKKLKLVEFKIKKYNKDKETKQYIVVDEEYTPQYLCGGTRKDEIIAENDPAKFDPKDFDIDAKRIVDLFSAIIEQTEMYKKILTHVSVTENLNHQNCFIKAILFTTKVRVNYQLGYSEFKSLCESRGLKISISEYEIDNIPYVDFKLIYKEKILLTSKKVLLTNDLKNIFSNEKQKISEKSTYEKEHKSSSDDDHNVNIQYKNNEAEDEISTESVLSFPEDNHHSDGENSNENEISADSVYSLAEENVLEDNFETPTKPRLEMSDHFNLFEDEILDHPSPSTPRTPNFDPPTPIPCTPNFDPPTPIPHTPSIDDDIMHREFSEDKNGESTSIQPKVVVTPIKPIAAKAPRDHHLNLPTSFQSTSTLSTPTDPNFASRNSTPIAQTTNQEKKSLENPSDIEKIFKEIKKTTINNSRFDFKTKVSFISQKLYGIELSFEEFLEECKKNKYKFAEFETKKQHGKGENKNNKQYVLFDRKYDIKGVCGGTENDEIVLEEKGTIQKSDFRIDVNELRALFVAIAEKAEKYRKYYRVTASKDKNNKNLTDTVRCKNYLIKAIPYMTKIGLGIQLDYPDFEKLCSWYDLKILVYRVLKGNRHGTSIIYKFDLVDINNPEKVLESSHPNSKGELIPNFSGIDEEMIPEKNQESTESPPRQSQKRKKSEDLSEEDEHRPKKLKTNSESIDKLDSDHHSEEMSEKTSVENQPQSELLAPIKRPPAVKAPRSNITFFSQSSTMSTPTDPNFFSAQQDKSPPPRTVPIQETNKLNQEKEKAKELSITIPKQIKLIFPRVAPKPKTQIDENNNKNNSTVAPVESIPATRLSRNGSLDSSVSINQSTISTTPDPAPSSSNQDKDVAVFRLGDGTNQDEFSFDESNNPDNFWRTYTTSTLFLNKQVNKTVTDRKQATNKDKPRSPKPTGNN